MTGSVTFKFKGATWRINHDDNSVLLQKVEYQMLKKKKNKPQEFKEHTVNYLRTYSVDQAVGYIAELENCDIEPVLEKYEEAKANED